MNGTKHGSPQSASDQCVAVWDPIVRLFHWTLVIAFFAAYFTDDDLITVHAWSGYLVGGIVGLRVFWGFVGPEHARFSDFMFGPLKVWGYLVDLIRFRAVRYLGHSPAGGAMVIALLLALGAVVWSGLELYAIEYKAGPFAQEAPSGSSMNLSPVAPRVVLASSAGDEEGRGASENDEDKGVEDGEEFWEELHEVLANVSLFLVILHIAGVALASVVYRENLVRSMISGKKRAPSGPG